MTGGRYTAHFRITDASGTASASATATFTYNAAPAITAQPSNQSITYGQDATFVAAATGSPTPGVVWQVSINSGGSWSNAANGGVYSGATATALPVAQPPVSLGGNQYLAIFTNSGGIATTNPATLSVAPSRSPARSRPATRCTTEPPRRRS